MSNKVKYVNAHIFNQRVIEDSFTDNFYKVLLREFDPHFFSHLHDIPLEPLQKEDVILHFYDFFSHLCKTYDGSDISRCYYFYYKDLSRQVSGAQSLVWNILFSFYILLDKSSELRAIRFALEKSKGKDAIEFFLSIKEMVAAVLSLNMSSLIMDNTYIQPSELAQAFSAIFDGKSITKMHLLTAVQNRCDSKGIGSGEFAAILLVDFIKTREKEEMVKNKPKDTRDSLSFINNKAMARTKQKFNFDGEGNNTGGQVIEEEPNNVGTHGSADNQRTAKTTTKMASPSARNTVQETRKGSVDKKKEVKKSMIQTRQDMINQVNYITQEKSKAEDQLVSCSALVRKNVKDYNDLLKYSQDMCEGFFELYYNLKTAHNQSEDKTIPKIPIKESQIKVYREIEKKTKKGMREELRNLITPQGEDGVAFPLVSSPHKPHQQDANKKRGSPNRSLSQKSTGK